MNDSKADTQNSAAAGMLLDADNLGFGLGEVYRHRLCRLGNSCVACEVADRHLQVYLARNLRWEFPGKIARIRKIRIADPRPITTDFSPRACRRPMSLPVG